MDNTNTNINVCVRIRPRTSTKEDSENLWKIEGSNILNTKSKEIFNFGNY
jgi:hypothetical protein